MKRTDLLRHLEANGCLLLREGAKHTVYHNPKAQRTATVPRHKEVKNPTASRICKDLAIPKPL
jgi:mRNA interferase HicA